MTQTDSTPAPSGRSTRHQSPRTLRLLFFLMGALVLVTILGNYLTAIWTGKAAARAVDIDSEVLHLQGLISTLRDAETGQRGYLLTGDQQYLEPYQRALGEIEKQLDA